MPDWRSVIRSRLASSSSGPIGPDDDVADEIAQHADVVFQRARADGASEEEATAAVERELRGLSALARAAKAARRSRLALPEPPPPGKLLAVRGFAGDLSYGARLLASRRGFTLAAVLTLALGIGANTAIFSVVNSLLLTPPPFENPARLVMVWETAADNPRDSYIVSAPNWKDWAAQSTTLQDFAIWEVQSYNLSGESEPEQVGGLRVSSSAFRMLGVRPQLGRTFSAAEDEPGHRVVVISDALWKRRFGGSATIVGQMMRLNGEPYEVIGVMPESFRFTHPSHAVWTPIQFNELDHQRSAHSFYAAARLKDGVQFETAEAEIRAIGRRLSESYPAQNRGEGATITRMDGLGVEPLQPTLFALVGAVAFVLLIACVNVANLVLAQATSRRREFAIRAALGAGRGRLASQLLAEGLLMALAGGAVGVLFAWLGTTALADSLPPAVRFAPFRNAGLISLDGRVLAFTSAIALLTGILFSLAPMLGVARTQPGAVLKATGDRGGTARLTLLRHALVAVEVALAVVVLFAAGLMIKSVARLVAVDPGLDKSNVLLMDIALPQPDFYGRPERTTFCSDMQRELAALPGVESVGAISHLPLSGANAGRGLTIEGRPIPAPGQGWTASYRVTCPGYFASLGIPVVRGRDFGNQDTTTSPDVVIINEETARRYFEGQDPVGHRLKLGGAQSTNPWLTIVGVVRDVRHFGLENPIRREIFRPYSQAAWPSMTITLKTAVEPLTLANAAKAALSRIDPDQPVSRPRTMDAVVADSIGGRRFPTLLLALFSAVALVLSAIGVYGVVNYVVSQRTREMGIRVALGARRHQVMQLVVGGALGPVAGGLAAGVAGAILSARLLSTLLYAVKPSDPAVLAGIVAILGTTAAAACWLPARRAATIDPLVALREE
jgi:putative ABC transport system permease protein